MGQFLEDQKKIENSFQCTDDYIIDVNKLLEIIVQAFYERNSSKLPLIDIEKFIIKTLKLQNFDNYKGLRKLLGNERLISLEDIKRKYGDVVEIKDIKAQNENYIKPYKDENKDIEYYYMTKTQRIPLKNVVNDTYNYFTSRNATVVSLNDIYEYLRNKYNVGSFNRKNLVALLGSNVNIPLSKVEALYINYNSIKQEGIDFDILTYLFVNNKNVMQKILNSLGKDFLISILKNGAGPIINITNSLNLYFKNEKDILELVNDKNDKVLDKQNSEMLVRFLNLFKDEEWFDILANDNQVNDYIELFVEDEKLILEKENFRKEIKSYYNFINKNNLEANTKYLFPFNIASILQEAKIYKVKDLVNINRDTSIKLFEYKKQFIEIVKRLQVDLQKYLNEQFSYILQMVNRNYQPATLWRSYVSILEDRSKGKTLQEAGDNAGVTRERVRQLERKYITMFNDFYNAPNGNLNNLLRAFVSISLFLTDADIIKIFPFNPRLFKYLLLNTEIDGLMYIEEIGKFYFVDDYDWYKELLIYIDELPSQFNINELDSIISQCLNNLLKNDIKLDYDDCSKILLQDYKLIGSIYSKTILSLADKFANLIKKYYPNPVNIYDSKFLSEFRSLYYKTYGDDKIKTDHAITSVIARIGMLVGRGLYVLNDKMFMSEELAYKIYNYIIDSGRQIFLTNNLYEIFKEELQAEGINNKYFMQGALKQRLGDKLFFRRDYVSTTNEVTSVYGEMVKFVKDAKRIVSYDEIQEEFKGTPWNVLIFALSQDDILNYRSKYVHKDTLQIDENDINYLKNVIDNLVNDGRIHHINDLYTFIKLTNKKLLDKLFVDSHFALFSVIQNLFESDYEMKRPFIAKKGTVIENQIDRINEFVRSNEIVSIDSILDFVSDNRLHLYSISEYVDSLEDYVFKDDKSIIELEKSGINKYNVEVVEKMILKAMKDEEFLFADKLPFYNLFPKGVDWTPWLVYSALNKYGEQFKAIPSDTKFKIKNNTFARPLIIRRDVKAININEFIQYLRNKKQMNDTEFYKYLRTKGLTE